MEALALGNARMEQLMGQRRDAEPMSEYLQLWDENHKKEQAAALQAPTGACHNCEHLRKGDFGRYTCQYPLPRAVLLREWQTVEPGKSTIRDCRVWKPKP